jgi:hypothetical protein
MNTVKNTSRERITYLLVIIPAIYFILGSYFRYLLGDLSLRSLDPDYIYYVTGLGISEGHFNVFHVDNPGTPLQYLMGLSYRLIYLVRPGNGTYLEDVFSNPDLYMAISNSVITGLTTALLYFAGSRIYKSTGSVLYGLLIQTTPFLAVIWYDLIGRIVPELLMPIPVIFLEIFLIELIYAEKNVESIRQISILAFISAIGLSVKLTYIPLWFIPFILVKTWKKKAMFVGLAILFFLMFAIPVTLRINTFAGWISSLFIHSGQYGGGESNFINWADFHANMNYLWFYEKWFLLTNLLALLTASGYFLFRKKEADRRLLLVTLAVLATVFLQTIMVGKHFEHRYYIPVLLLFPVLVFLIAEFAGRILPGKFHVLISSGLIVFLVAFFVHQQPWIKLKAETMSADMAQREETRRFVSTLKPNSIKIITTQNYGGPYREYALMVSYIWSGNQQKYYTETLAGLYPDTYLFFTWDNTFRFWGEKFDAQKIIDSGKSVYLYIERNDEELYNRTLTRIQKESETGFTAERVLIFSNAANSETLYQLKLTKAEKTDSIKGSMEKTVPVSIAN